MSVTQKDLLIDKCLEWVGYKEKKTSDKQYYDDKDANAGSNNWNRFSYIYDLNMGTKKDGYPWCATFICACLIESAGLSETKRLMLDTVSASCTQIRNAFRSRGRFYSAPETGDFVIFSDSSGDPAHIGVVTKVSSGTVYTVEGNTSGGSTVIANGGSVAEKSYSRSYSRIVGYCRPDYMPVKPDENGCPFPEPSRNVKKGDTGIEVKWVQWYLGALGYAVGAIDGDFGKDTDAATRRFQNDCGLAPDGIVGVMTRNALKDEARNGAAEEEKMSYSDFKAYLKQAAEDGALHKIIDEYMQIDSTGDDAPEYAEEAIKYCVERGYFKGDPNGNFGWTKPILRCDSGQLIFNIEMQQRDK